MEIREAITAEQAKFLHGNLPPAIIGGTIVVLLIVFVFWDVVRQDYLLAWAGAVVVLTSARLWNWRAYRARTFTLAVSRRWLRTSTVGAGLSGVTWGIGSLFLVPPGEIVYQVIFLWALSMMALAAMFSFSAHVPTYMAYFLPSTLPALVVLALQATVMHTGFLLGVLLYIVIVPRFVAAYNRMFFEAQKLRFENLDLVGQLTAQIEVARTASLAKSRFLAAASHDLRQPMHALSLYLGALGGQELPRQSRDTLASAAQCAQTMDGMFRALLDISRLDAGSIQPECRALPVAPLLERIRHEHEPQAHAKGLRLRVAPCSAWVRADPVFLERILRNFASNAVRYTERGSILIGARRRNGALRISVHDTGPGIATAEQRLVFEEFYQIGNDARERSKGMGLGLAIVDRLARLMQARVELASEPGRGSAFSVELPLAPAGSATAAKGPHALAPREGFAGRLVAVVDDEEMILHATRALLEQWQCKVVTAVSARDAIEQLSSSSRPPDAIVCDYRLAGGESGLAVIDALRSEFNDDIPALLITGDSGPERLREIEASGLSVLHKPVQDASLREALGALLRVQPPA